ncbi:MAG: hypothetical protein KDB00_06010 [Planctomycetales bacterium]|nr:hypothetical protein [Planctomycetales bacterium]
MTINLYKKHVDVALTDGISSSDDEVEVFYFARTDAEEDDEAVQTHCIDPANIPHDYRGLGIFKIRIERLEEDDSIWSVTAYYAARSASWTLPKLNTGEFRWRIRNANLGSRKMTQSQSLVSEITSNAAFAYTGTPIEKAVGIVGNSKGGYEIEGTDRPIGAVLIDVEAVIEAAAITSGYLVTAAQWAAQNAVNSVAWEGFAEETLSIIGYDAKPRSANTGDDPDWDVFYTFHFEPNLTGLTIGSIPGTVNKKGHDYLDVLFARTKVNNLTVAKPVRAAVHQQYPKIAYGTVLKLEVV